ncbi:MAG: hypothetical protein SGPRY_000480 [Prymnesium sp.]
MGQMYHALQQMGVDTEDDPYKASFAPACQAGAPQPRPRRLSRGLTIPLPSSIVRGGSIPASLLPRSQWADGPNDPAGRVGRASERPLLCMSVLADTAVVGSSDHGLSEFDLRPSAGGLRRKRELYTKAYGHSEWVTDVAHTADGRVISAGMDSKLCLWNASGGARCKDLLGHTGSVSRVVVTLPA